MTAEMSAAASKGIKQANDRAICKGYRPHYDFRFEVVKGEIRDGVPVFRVNLSGYQNSNYDQGGFQYAAGQFIPPDKIRLPEYPAGADLTWLTQAVDHEAEHRILYANDRAEYQRTLYHLDGGHPLIVCN